MLRGWHWGRMGNKAGTGVDLRGRNWREQELGKRALEAMERSADAEAMGMSGDAEATGRELGGQLVREVGDCINILGCGLSLANILRCRQVLL